MKTNIQYRVIKRASLEKKQYMIQWRKLETHYRYFGMWGPYEEWGRWNDLTSHLGLILMQYSTAEEASQEIDRMIKQDRAYQTPDEIVAVFE